MNDEFGYFANRRFGNWFIVEVESQVVMCFGVGTGSRSWVGVSQLQQSVFSCNSAILGERLCVGELLRRDVSRVKSVLLPIQSASPLQHNAHHHRIVAVDFDLEQTAGHHNSGAWLAI